VGVENFAATVLQSGQVLITGGDCSGGVEFAAYLYDPATNTMSFALNSMTAFRSGHQATLLRNGNVLITGGTNGRNGLSHSAELFVPNP
jgi:hypothetical protein